MKPTLEQLWRGNQRGPLTLKASSAANQFSGLTTLNSGSATVTVSTTQVKSDALISLTMQAATRQNSGFAKPLEVSSLVHGSYFVIATADGVAIPRSTTVMWEIKHTS